MTSPAAVDDYEVERDALLDDGHSFAEVVAILGPHPELGVLPERALAEVAEAWRPLPRRADVPDAPVC